MSANDKTTQDRQQQIGAGVIADNLPSADLLTKEQIEALLPKLDGIIGWAKQVQEYALEQALKGTRFEGYKVVAGRANRKFIDTDQVVDRLLGEGYDEAMIYERSLKTLTQIEALVGKKNFPVILGDLVDTPPGKPALVPADDKRPELSPDAAAAADFK